MSVEIQRDNLIEHLNYIYKINPASDSVIFKNAARYFKRREYLQDDKYNKYIIYLLNCSKKDNDKQIYFILSLMLNAFYNLTKK